MPSPNKRAGRALRRLRNKLGLSMREVFAVSKEIAKEKSSRDFLLPPAVLSLIETKGLVPSIYRLHTLKLAYKVSMSRLLSLFGL